MSDATVYPITAALEAEVAKADSRLGGTHYAAAIIEAVGEYEHGTASVEDVSTGLTLQQYADVALDIILTLTVDRRTSIKPTRLATTTFMTRTWRSGQSWEHERGVKLGEHKLRIRIKHDSYQAQSFSLIERWDGDQWRQLDQLDGNNMASWKVSPHTFRTVQDVTEHFMKDVESLLRVAKHILL